MHANRRQMLLSGAAALTTLAAPAFIRHARAANVPRFTLGVASGQPRADRLVLWTRLMGIDLPARVPVQWELANDEAFRDIAARGTELADAASAHSVHAEPAALQPGRWYWYRFTALGQRSAVGRTRTAPADDAAATLRFAIASCQRWDHGHFAAWRHMAEQPLDLVMFLGDYIYEYPSKPEAVRPVDGPLLRTLGQYRDRYAQYKTDPALQAAHAAFPWLVIWDDHEVENDHSRERGQLRSGADFQALRGAAYQAWWEHQPVPKGMRPTFGATGSSVQLYDRYAWGRLARIHTLDDRQYRDPHACPSPLMPGGSRVITAADCAALQDPKRSLLGWEQERWLAEGWDLQRPWNLLAQQTLMAQFSRQPVTGINAGEFWTDGWDGYAPSRERLLGTVAERKVPGVVVLGGDVHANYVADLKRDFQDPKSPVLASEFCGTSISSHGPSQARVNQLLALNPHVHHGRGDQRGYVAFALSTQTLQASLMVVEHPNDAMSAVRPDAQFVVDAKQAGPQRT
jgi:alkaline phosphatase D